MTEEQFEVGAARTDGIGQAIGRQAATLPSLDLGRFVAAALVMFFHYSYTILTFTGAQPFALLFRAGHAGVEYFFVLSGFIIAYAHRKDLGQPGRIGSFFAKRAIRILPMLWLTLIVWGTLRAMMPSETTNGLTGFRTLVLDMLLIPHDGTLILGVTWTLTRELVFYLLFSICLINRNIGIAVLAAWQAGIVVCAIFTLPLGIWTAQFFDIHNIGFGIGLAIALSGALSRARAILVAIIGCAMFTCLMLVEWRVGGQPDVDALPLGMLMSPTLYSLAAGVLLFGLAAYDQRQPRPERKLVRYLAGSSYVLYLTHGPVSSLLVRLIARLPFHLPAEILFVLMSLAGVAAALVLHLFLERPIMHWLRHRLVRRRAVPVRTVAET